MDYRELEAKIDFEITLEHLSPRQREVVNLFLEGYNFQEIADKLGIVRRTARTHFDRAKEKLSPLYTSNMV